MYDETMHDIFPKNLTFLENRKNKREKMYHGTIFFSSKNI